MFFRERGGPQVSPASEDGGDEQAIKATDISRVDVHEITAVRSLNALNENIRSLREVNFPAYGVARPSTLLSLSLHSNRLSSLEGFSSVTVSGAFLALYFFSNNQKNVRSCPARCPLLPARAQVAGSGTWLKSREVHSSENTWCV